MHLRSLDLEEFRSYHRLRIDLDPRGLRLSGPNASGKSTLFEAIAMLATTRSPRSSAEREVINWGSGRDVGFPPYARIHGSVTRAAGDVDLEIALQADPERPGNTRKQIKLNGRSVRAMDAVGALKAVLFSPEDVALVSGPPSGRRRYLDLTISQLDGGYLRALSRYNRVLAQRNSLLKALARHRVVPTSAAAGSQLAFWDTELVAFGSVVVSRRLAVVHRLSQLARQRFEWLTRGGSLSLSYQPSLILPALGEGAGGVDGDGLQAMVSREFEIRLGEARTDEVRRGMSLVGPHRDDVAFTAAGVDIAVYGSRGQQRLAVIALKLAEADLMTEVALEPPVLLLDDVLSELDEAHRSLLTETAARLGAQVLVSATDESLLDAPDLAGMPRARVETGVIELAAS